MLYHPKQTYLNLIKINKWHNRFMEEAFSVAEWSKDVNTKVGCVIVGKDRRILDKAYNGFPRGVDDSLVERYERPLKYIFTQHAERNAIDNCARDGVPMRDSVMYTTLFPCHECARSIIQAGIRMVVYSQEASERFTESSEYARIMFKEANVEILNVEI